MIMISVLLACPPVECNNCNICQNYDTNHQLLYNGVKSFSLCFKNNFIKIKQLSPQKNSLKK